LVSCWIVVPEKVSVKIHADFILVLDFGSQYTQLIARRVREAGVYCEIHPWDRADEALQRAGIKGIILSGGPESVTLDAPPRISSQVFDFGVPVLGICYGMQAMALQLGGEVETCRKREFGYAQVRARGHTLLLQDIEDHITPEGHGLLDVWMSHGDRVCSLPAGFKLMASTDSAPIAGMADEQRQFYGLQFHPEVTHTRQGTRILKRFLHEICGCRALWKTDNIIDEYIAALRNQIGQDEVILALSGGVDSSVVGALLHKAIGEQLTGVFVDTGLLRLRESDQVMTSLARHMGVRVIKVDAEHRFLSALKGVVDPEQKRKIIGRLFIEIFNEVAVERTDAVWLAQGTIYPDIIESAAATTGKAHLIKSHHNVGGLPAEMAFKLVEPLRDLFKDEVRKIGLELGLPSEMVHRHPFPGPGLGVRILGEVKKEYADLLRQADDIFIAELRKYDLYDRVSQAFAVFLPVRTVGVMGDGRRYDYVIALRAVETTDFMTARYAHLPYEFLDHVARRIINEVEGISRVTYDISGKPPATIEWE
jgi:GMP synthase (glutamine-hydrolysing)